MRNLLNIFAHSAIISLALGSLFIFKPFTYIDNAQSQIICNKDGQTFELGWNFIYTFSDKLDSFNDTKARKLCEYKIIKDYSNTYQTPAIRNYDFRPKYIQESSWPEAIFMFFAMLIFGALIIELTNNTLKVRKSSSTHPEGEKITKISLPSFLLFFTSIFFASLLFFFLFKKPAAMIYCKRQVARKVNNFKRIIFKYGIIPIPEEDEHIKSILPDLYESCLAKQGFLN